MVKNIHMEKRMMGVTFTIMLREAGDSYIDSQFKNSLDMLLSDAANYGTEVVLRKVIMSYITLGLAQNLVNYYHAATKELYYYMRKYDEETYMALMKDVQSIIERSKH